MCVNCDDSIINDAFAALDPVFRMYGQRTVIDAIHNYYHHVQPTINQNNLTLWDQGFGFYDEWQEEYGLKNGDV